MSVLNIPKTSEEWEYKFIPHLTSGLNQADKPDDVRETELTTATNVRYDKNRVLLDTGYKKFGTTLVGDVRATFQFWRKTGDAYLVAITDSSFYVWNESSSQWQFVYDGTNRTELAAAASENDASIEVDSAAAFTAGDLIGITLANGLEHQTTIDSIAGTTITLAEAMSGDADLNGEVLLATKLTGSAGVPVSIEVFPATDYMIFVNGSDAPKKFDGVTVEDLAGMPTSPFTARVVKVFKDHLLFLYTTESGTIHPQRVRRSDTGDPEEWSAGNAGYTDLFESEDWIAGAEHLGPYLMIYKERSIIRCEYVGLAEELFSFASVIFGEGARSLDSVVSLGDEHIFFGRANIYRYKGGYSLDPIGDPLYHKIFSVQGHLNPSDEALVHGIYVEEVDEVWFFYPTGEDTQPKTMVRISASSYALAEREFTTGVTGYGFYVLLESKDWAALEGDWSAQTWEWGSRSTLANAPTTHLCLGTQVAEYDYLSSTDDGTEIPYKVDTGDFYMPNTQARFDRLSVSARGESVDIFYSLDRGDSWTHLKTITPGVSYTRVRIWKQFVGRVIRFRFTGTGGNFGLEWVAFEYAIESEW